MRDDVGQLLWVGFQGTELPAALAKQLDAGTYGVAILFRRNIRYVEDVADLEALVALNRDLHRKAPDGTPALIAIDQEGGRVARVRAPATLWPPMMQHDRSSAPDDVRTAEAVGLAVGQELRALGVDIDFAPVLDVHTNPANPIIGDRAFGTVAETVTRRALAFARGLDAAGVLACGKHFPGHGDTDTDSHLALPRIDHDWARLESVELAPFKAAAAAGLPMVMTAHVVFGALDAAVPATLSKQVITGLLRERLGYRGVIVSDDLDMNAIAANMGADRAAVGAIRAGCDVVLLCCDEANQQLAEEGLVKAAEGDSELRRRIGESAERVRAMKRAHVANQAKHPAPGLDIVGSAAHRELAERLGR